MSEQHREPQNLRNQKNKIILIITFLVAIAGYSLWEYLQQLLEMFLTKEEAEIKAVNFFFLCIELTFVGYTFVIKELIKNDEDKYFKYISEFIFCTTVATVVDRIFGDPYIVSFYDYLIFFINILLTFRWKIIELLRWNKRLIILRKKLTTLKIKLTALKLNLIRYFST